MPRSSTTPSELGSKTLECAMTWHLRLTILMTERYPLKAEPEKHSDTQTHDGFSLVHCFGSCSSFFVLDARWRYYYMING